MTHELLTPIARSRNGWRPGPSAPTARVAEEEDKEARVSREITWTEFAGGEPGDESATLWQASWNALAIVDDERRYKRINDGASQMLLAPAEDVLKLRIEHFTPEERRPQLAVMWRHFERSRGLQGFYEIQRTDGSRAMIEFRASRDFQPGRHLLVAREVNAITLASKYGQPTHAVPRLTKREREVLQLTAQGRPAPEIAELLCVSPSTIKSHLQRAYERLGARDRASAVAIALRLGLID
jgi:DNA-binding CsgD family transcriptional regulator